MVGLGALLALSPDTPQRLGDLLFGNPLAVGTAELVLAWVVAAGGALALAAMHRPLAAVVFDPIASGSLGVPGGRVRVALTVLLATVVCVAAQGLGSLLALAAIVAPPLAVRRHVRSAGQALVAGAAVGAAGGIAGIYASYWFDVAAGAAVALGLCGLAVVGALLPARSRATA
jgi:ABC-type Mn2+/Zn2+ transport system permease subunit